MDSERPNDELRQIGDLDVEDAILEESGESLSEIAARLGLRLEDFVSDDLPDTGWRILTRHENGSGAIGAPADSTGLTWRVVSVGPRESGQVFIASEPLPLRPSRAERRRGLLLRWPALMTDGSFRDDFVIDIVNAGESRWIPSGDSFLVVGALVSPGVTDYSFGWMQSQAQPALPLDSGEYARVRVSINLGVWQGLEPGEYDVQAHLVGLGVRPDRPLRVLVTREQIDAHQSRLGRSGASRAVERRMLDSEIQRIELTAAAMDQSAAVIEAIANAASDSAAIDALSSLLNCDQNDAQTVLHLPLRELGAAHRATSADKIAELTRRRDALTEPETAVTSVSAHILNA